MRRAFLAGGCFVLKGRGEPGTACAGWCGRRSSCAGCEALRLRYERIDWRRHRYVRGSKDFGRAGLSPADRGRRYYGRSNLARLSEGFGEATQVESAGYVVAALCGLGRIGNRPDKITLNPDDSRRFAARGGPGGDVSWTSTTGRGRDRPESRGAIASTRRHEPCPTFKEVTRK